MKRSPQDIPAQSGTWRLALAVLLVAFGAAMTLVPHAWNITPMGAIALLAAAYILNRPLAMAIPLAALAISDVTKTLLDPAWGVTQATLLVFAFKYLGFVGVVLCGWLVRRRARNDAGRFRWGEFAASVAAAGLAGAVVFFLVSNLGCWLTPIFAYERSAAGLMRCYADGLPFFRAMLLGDLVYVPLLFGAFALAERTVPALSPTRA